MTPSSLIHLDFNSFLAWQRIQLGDNPAGSKGFSCNSCRGFQGKYNKGHPTRRGHSNSLHSTQSRKFTQLGTFTQLCTFTALQVYTARQFRTAPQVRTLPLSGLVVRTCYCSDSLQRLYTNTFLTVSIRVSSSVAAVATLTFTAPPSRSSVFSSILPDLTQNSQHYLRNAPSTQEIAHKDQYTSHLQTSQPKNSITATLSWSILLTNYGTTQFTLVLRCAPLALDMYMLVYFRILWHRLVIVWLLVPHGKYWHSQTYNN